MKTLVKILFLFIGFPGPAFTATVNDTTERVTSPDCLTLHAADSNAYSKPVYQIRIYELKDSNKEHFFIRFRDHASRIMKRHGFNILKMWETRYNGKPEFVYLLKWKDEASLKKAWENFFADEEWIKIKDYTNEKYGGLVGERKEDRLLQEVISPQ